MNIDCTDDSKTSFIFTTQLLQFYMLHFSRELRMHEVVNAGLGLVYSKDVFSEVGLAQQEVIHSSTPQALEKTSQDALQRALRIRGAKHSSCRLGDPGELGCEECEEPSSWKHNDIQRKALSVVLSSEMEAQQQVCEGNLDISQNNKATSSLISPRHSECKD